MMRHAVLGKILANLTICVLLLTACAAPPAATPIAGPAAAPTARAGMVPEPMNEGGEPAALDAAQLIDWGEAVYATNCAPCHQPNGEGNLRLFPALNGNALVTASQPTALIQTVLHGRGVMPAFASTLSNQELAAVLSYVRNAWNNEAAPISGEQIRSIGQTASAE